MTCYGQPADRRRPGPAGRPIQAPGFRKLAHRKEAAANRWCAAVTAEGTYGPWTFAMIRQPAQTAAAVAAPAASLGRLADL